MLERELFDLLEGTSDAAFAISDEDEICSWNKAAERLFGYSASEALHKTFPSLLHGRGPLGNEMYAENCSLRRRAEKHLEIPNFDLEVKVRSGRRIWVNVSTLVYENPRNHRRLIVHLAHDITDRKKIEELLHKMLDISRQLPNVQEVALRPVPVTPLSEQEKEILRSFSMGKNSTEIARILKITLQTLRNHLHHINQKLHTHNRLEAVTHAMQRKLLMTGKAGASFLTALAMRTAPRIMGPVSTEIPRHSASRNSRRTALSQFGSTAASMMATSKPALSIGAARLRRQRGAPSGGPS